MKKKITRLKQFFKTIRSKRMMTAISQCLYGRPSVISAKDAREFRKEQKNRRSI